MHPGSALRTVVEHRSRTPQRKRDNKQTTSQANSLLCNFSRITAILKGLFLVFLAHFPNIVRTKERINNSILSFTPKTLGALKNLSL